MLHWSRYALGVLLLMFASQSVAQIPALLPDKADVAPTQALPIDGVWTISGINKRIRVEQGRAYAVDPWTHAFVLRIKKDMVVIRDLVQTGANTYEADDLPLLTRTKWTLQDNGRIGVAAGLIRYELVPADDQARSAAAVSVTPDTYSASAAGTPTQPAASAPVVRAPAQGRATPIEKGSIAAVPEFVAYDAFTGCAPAESETLPTDSPRERMQEAARVDTLTQRRFAAFSLDEVERGVEDERMQGLCWQRLDGVWRQMGGISLDRSKDNAEVWGSSAPELTTLANGNYTLPTYLYVGSVGNDDSELWITDSAQPDRYVRYVSDDGLSIADTLKRDGPRKMFRAQGNAPLGAQLMVDVTRSGRVRLKLGNKTFLRPQPGVSEATMSSQVAANDAFLLSYNLENLSASRKGYDVITQDPFFLLENNKFDVFAEVDSSSYFISEKRTVPLGLTLVQEATQGMVYNRSMVTSASEMQTTVSATFGANMTAGNDNVASTSAAFEATASHMRSMEQSKSVAQAVGYSRAKQYALVVDHPFAKLSDDFLDAVEDARRYGNYDALLNNFGTHYPYAVTYGAAAKVTQSVSEEAYKEIVHVEGGFSAEYAAESASGGGGANFSVNASNTSGTSGSIGEEGATFVAVGGNGSWNENGYSAGQTPYPILLDLRPLSQLLNPMHFPDEPEIYIAVRKELERRIDAYLSQYANKLSSKSLLPKVEPRKAEPIEVWHFYVRHAWCTGTGSGRVNSAVGTLEMEAYRGSKSKGYASTKKKSLSTKCKIKKKSTTYSYKVGDRGLIEVRGTRAQMAEYKLDLGLDWRYTPSSKKKFRRHDKVMKPTKALRNGLAPGTSKDYHWVVGAKTLPDFTLNVRMKRIK